MLQTNFFFREKASGREKLFTIFLVIWFALVAYGGYSGFVPEEDINRLCWYASIPVGLFIYIPLIFDRHPSNKIYSVGLIKRTAIYLFLLPTCFVMAWAGMALGGGAVATHYFGQHFSGTYVVTGKGDGRFRWKAGSCNGNFVYVKELGGVWRTLLCVDRKFWQEVHAGDEVFATGYYSRLGILLDEWELAELRGVQ